MSSTKLSSPPKLDKPGAGLPFGEWAVAKYILFPIVFATTGKEKAIATFVDESEKIVSLSRPLSLELLSQQRLVPRLIGLEDSSRYWSVAMTLEHLVIVTDGMRQIATDLSRGGTKLQPRGTADVKPGGNVDPAKALDEFESMVERFVVETNAAELDAFPNATFPHPWFGPLNARKWLTLAAPHASIHRKQVEGIVSRL